LVSAGASFKDVVGEGSLTWLTCLLVLLRSTSIATSQLVGQDDQQRSTTFISIKWQTLND
jgi:hypothetical protein